MLFKDLMANFKFELDELLDYYALVSPLDERNQLPPPAYFKFEICKWYKRLENY